MVLTDKEKIIAIISNGIAAYSIRQERKELPKNVTIYDFILKAVPPSIKLEISADLIDEVFLFVSSAHNS